MYCPKDASSLGRIGRGEASSLGRIVQGTHRPRDASSKGRIVHGTHRPRDASSLGCIVLGMHRPWDASSKRCIVQGTEHPRLFVREPIGRGHIVMAPKEGALKPWQHFSSLRPYSTYQKMTIQQQNFMYFTTVRPIKSLLYGL
jgi:hypothetical protein